jgi:hypothetical protein
LIVPFRTPSQLGQLQFHCGKPPPAAEPSTLTLINQPSRLLCVLLVVSNTLKEEKPL